MFKLLFISVFVCFFASSNFIPTPAKGAAETANVFIKLDKLLDVYDYYDVEPLLRDLNQKDHESKILAELVLIFHEIRTFQSLSKQDPLIQNLRQQLNLWESGNFDKTVKFSQIIEPIKNLYEFEYSDKTKEARFDAASKIIMLGPKNFIDAWIQCYVQVTSEVNSYDVFKTYQTDRLENVCPSKYSLTHMPLAGLTNVAVQQGFSIEKNNEIGTELYSMQKENNDLYAKAEIYIHLLNFAAYTQQNDLILAVRENLKSLIYEIEKKGFVNEILYQFDFFFDFIVQTEFPDLISDQQIEKKYNKLTSLYPNLYDFIKKIDLDQHSVLLRFLNSIEHQHGDIFFNALLNKWTKFSDKNEKKWNELTKWIGAISVLADHQIDKFDDLSSAIKNLENLITFHDELYETRFETFRLGELKEKPALTMAEVLNGLVVNNQVEPIIDPSIYRVHADLGYEYLYLENYSKALSHLQLAWDKMPKDLKFNFGQSVFILSDLGYVNSILGDKKAAANYAELTIKAWKNIFEKNNDYLFIQRFEDSDRWRSTLSHAVLGLWTYGMDPNLADSELNRIDELTFTAQQLLRMNRITLAHLNENKKSKLKEINILDQMNKAGSITKESTLFRSIFDAQKELKNRDLEFTKFSEINWKIPLDTIVLMAYDAGYSTYFGLIETFHNEPVFASIDTDELKEKIDSIFESLQLTDEGSIKDFDFESSRWIFDKIFKNELSSIYDFEKIKNIVFLPSKDTFNFPLGLLHNGLIEMSENGNEIYSTKGFLIEKFNISNFIGFDDNFKAEVLIDPFTELFAKYKPVNSQSFLGIGNPYFGSLDVANYRAISFVDTEITASQEISFPRLPETEDEVLQVAGYFDPNKSKVLLGRKATKSEFTNSSLDKFDVLMLSTHGINRNLDRGVEETALVLGWGEQNEKGEINEILLSPAEILQFELDADLTIINTCNSGLPNLKNAPGLTGIAQSFLAAGSDAVMVSNWPISSSSTANLMSIMFDHLKTNPKASFNSALNFAQKQLKSKSETSHPFFWAPYSIFGNF